MTKTFCDRCKTEANVQEYSPLKPEKEEWSGFPPFGVGYKRELCKNCATLLERVWYYFARNLPIPNDLKDLLP